MKWTFTSQGCLALIFYTFWEGKQIIMGLFDLFKKKEDSSAHIDKKKISSKGNTSNHVLQQPGKTRPPYLVSDAGKMRYAFEHQVLRDLFYSNTRQFVNGIVQDNVIYDLACKVAEMGKWENPYKSSDIHVDTMRWNADISFVSIELPVPEYSLLCYRIHMLFSDSFTNLGYYTIEAGMGNNGFLCGWDGDRHLNFHEIASPDWDDQNRGFCKALEAYVLTDLHAERFGLSKRAGYT